MNHADIEFIPWSRRRWVWTILSILALQLGLIGYLSDRTRFVPRPVHSPGTLRLVTNPSWDQQLARALTLSDPTLFAFAHEHNFSGGAWLNLPPLTHPAWTWRETGQWLAPPEGALGTLLPEFVRTNMPQRVLVSEKPGPSVQELLVPIESAPTQTVVRVEGSLAAHALVISPEVHSWPHKDLLPDTVVQVMVNQAGEPFSSWLITSCGLGEADQFALRSAKKTRFAAVAPAQTDAPESNSLAATWGSLVFQWHTTETVPTNPPPTKP